MKLIDHRIYQDEDEVFYSWVFVGQTCWYWLTKGRDGHWDLTSRPLPAPTVSVCRNVSRLSAFSPVKDFWGDLDPMILLEEIPPIPQETIDQIAALHMEGLL